MASIHPAPSESQVNVPTKVLPVPSKEELNPIPEPKKNADNEIKPGQALIWVFTGNEIALIALQIVATVIGAIFGAWAIRSYDTAKIANEQTSMANQLAILALCQIDPFNSSPACSAVRSVIQLPSLMSAVIPSLTIPQSSNLTTTIFSPSSTVSDSTITSFLPTPPPASPSIPITTPTAPDTIQPTTIFPPADTTNTPTASATATLTNPLTTLSATVIRPQTSSSTATNPTGAPIATISSSLTALEELSMGGVIGVIVGIVVFIAIIGLLIVGRRRVRMRSKEPLAHAEV